MKRGVSFRPDFVMLPEGSVGLYGRDAYDENYEVSGVDRLVIAEIKKPNVTIGSDQKEQPWRYVKELIRKGFVTTGTKVDCFVLGSKIDSSETGKREEWDRRVVIQPLLYTQFVRRAEARMLGLRDKLVSAPFLREHGIDGETFIAPREPLQRGLFSGPIVAV